MSRTACHECSVPGCTVLVLPEILMCRYHWRHLPYEIRPRVYAAWNGWRCGEVTLEDLRAVQAEATEAVLQKLGNRAAVKGGA